MSKSVIAKRSRAYRLLGTHAVLSFLYTLQAVLAGGSGEAQVPASPGSGRRRGAMGKRAVVVGSLAVALAGITLAGEAGAQVPPLSALPVPRPANLADFVRDAEAAKVLGKALFWDMQVGSDGVQACATCHFRAGADPRKKNQISPGLLRVAYPEPGPVVGPGPRLRLRWAGARTTGSAERISPSGSSQIPRIASRQSPRTRTTWCPRRACTTPSLARRAGRDPTPMAFGRASQRSPRRAAQHADDDQRGLQPSQLLGPAGPEPVQRREPVRQPRCQRVPLPRRRPFEPPEDNGVPRQLEPRLAGGGSADEPVRDVGRRADVPRRRRERHAGAGTAAAPRPGQAPPKPAASREAARSPRRQRPRPLQPLAVAGPERRLRESDSPRFQPPVVGLAPSSSAWPRTARRRSSTGATETRPPTSSRSSSTTSRCSSGSPSRCTKRRSSPTTRPSTDSSGTPRTTRCPPRPREVARCSLT